MLENKAHFTVHCHGLAMHCGDVCKECGFQATTADLLAAHGLSAAYPPNILMERAFAGDVERQD